MFHPTQKTHFIKSVLLAAFLILFTSSCQNSRQNHQINRDGLINTYSSPSAYYGKPISRMFVNPYDLDGPGYYFDNDVYYKPTDAYGIGHHDNYRPRNGGW